MLVQTCLISSSSFDSHVSQERQNTKVKLSPSRYCVTCAPLEEFVTDVESSGAAFRLWGLSAVVRRS